MAEHFQTQIRKDFKRNVFFIVLFEALWAMGMGFALFIVMLPSYLSEMGAPKTLIGFIQTGFTTFAFVQLFSSYFFSGEKRRFWTYVIYTTASGCLFLSSLVCLCFHGIPPKAVALWLFSVMACFYIVFISLALPLYNEISTDLIPRKRRGLLFGLKLLAIGSIGFLSTFPGKMLMTKLHFPKNYYVCILIMSSLYLLSCFSVFGIRDHINPAHATEKSRKIFTHLKKSVINLVCEPNFRIFIFFYICIAVASGIGISFIIPYARDVLGTPESKLALFSRFFFISAVFGGLLMGKIADSFGYRWLGIVLSFMLLSSFIMIISAKDITVLYLAYIPQCLSAQCSIMLMLNMGVEISEKTKPSELYATGSILSIPFVMGSSLICGAVIDKSADYFAVMIAAAIFSGIALMGFLIIIREPRRGDIFMIKPLRRF